MKPAVFLDRDGVINKNVFYEDTGCWESPRTASDFVLCDYVIDSLRDLRQAGYTLFLVSNQPNVAKGKSSRQELDEIHFQLQQYLDDGGIQFAEFYYCYHHPKSNVPGYGGPCECRKPSPHFLRKAAKEHSIDLSSSWMIGDRITDIECGIGAGAKTIYVISQEMQNIGFDPEQMKTFSCANVKDATRHILAMLREESH